MSNQQAGIAAFAAAVSLISIALSAACDSAEPSANETDALGALELSASEIPASPTNMFADNPDAAALGQRLFFDRRLSSDGSVACANCHDPKQGFSDPKRLSEGVGKQLGTRHSMPIRSAALEPFLLWDGRADSAWRQPLYALENPREMNFTRSDVALFIVTSLPAEYASVFGSIPDLGAVPAHVGPGDGAWEELATAQKDAVQRIFVNVGKALEAYERLLACTDTRFDQWARGEVTLSTTELDGAGRFVRSGCIRCHSGPALSDGKFHNLGLIHQNDPAIDRGRAGGIELLLADPLNGASAYSDDAGGGTRKLAGVTSETATLGAFRTASLRGVTQRPRFGHLGQQTSLEEFIDDTYRRGGRGGRDDDDRDGGIVGTRDPILDDVHVDDDDAEVIAAFLRTTECPAVPPSLLAP